ncbi:hypothetical protein LX32DRAFT_646965 [Colletotrichum zoysiae]|uniref:Uncharacterized protein n=1 Tax=Colletotrichum zoysiae TaxID=1216348 RepID=A0AAD9H3J5_9PEZI|nr:hypothetical protein LX32DRAFT_646965 [Colletotrichum zoysiae]
MPGAAIRGGLVSGLGSCKPIHHFPWAIALLGLGLFALMDRDSSTGGLGRLPDCPVHGS